MNQKYLKTANYYKIGNWIFCYKVFVLMELKVELKFYPKNALSYKLMEINAKLIIHYILTIGLIVFIIIFLFIHLRFHSLQLYN
jgi:hypothetical protein